MPAAPPSRLPDPGARDVLYLLDLSGYVFRAYHALPPLSSSRGEPTHAVLGTVNMLQKVVAERRPHLFVVAMDSRGPTFRHGLDTRYKATRPAPPPDLSQQMARVEQIVHAWDVACFSRSGFEADDLIATVTARAIAEGWRVVIVSADKDLMQLVHDDDNRVVLWDSMRDRVYGPREVREKLGVPPSQVRDFLALTGDTSDNIPGVPGVGPKTAADLLAQFGTIEGLLANVEQVTKPKLRESLKTHEGDARISQRLVTLDASSPIEWDQSKLLWGGANVPELRRLYTELEFQRQLDQLDVLAGAGGQAPLRTAPGQGPSGPSSEQGPGASGRAPPSPSAEGAGALVAAPTEAMARVYEVVLDAPLLERLIAQARERGQVGIAAAVTSDDAMRAELLGVSLSIEPGRGYYVPLAHRYLGSPKQLEWSVVRDLLAPLLADRAVSKVGFDVKRAAIVLARAGAPFAGPTFDVLVGAYLLDPETPNGLKELARRELGVVKSSGPADEAAPRARGPQPLFDEIEVERAAAMAAPDAELPVALRERIEPRLEAERLDALMRDVEVPLETVLAAMEMRGVLVDVPTLERIGQKAEESLRELESACKRIAGRDFVVRSRDQLEKILFDELRLPVVKRTPKGGARRTPTCSRPSPISTSCRSACWSFASSTSSRARTSTRCRAT